jgi:Calx-beta domain
MRSLPLVLAAALAVMAGSGHAANPAPVFQIADVSCTEGLTCAVTITKSAKANTYSQLRVTTSPGTAKAGVDFVSVSQVVTFGNTELRKTFQLSLVNDQVSEPTEQFQVAIAGARFATISRAVATVTVADNDPAPPTTQTCWDGSVIPIASTCPAKPVPVQCPDGSTVPQGQVCPVTPPDPQPVTWVPAPLRNGGYARITKVEPGPWSELNVLGHAPAIVGSVWYVVPGAWGYTATIVASNPDGHGSTTTEGRYVQAIAPMDRVDVPFAGFYVYLDDIEGVAPAVPAAGVSGMPFLAAAAAPALKIIDTDDSYLATGLARCMGLGMDHGELVPQERSSVEFGQQYRVSVREAGDANKHFPVLLVSASPVGSSTLGRAIVPSYCLTPKP